MPNRKNTCGKGRSRFLSAIGFFAPFLIALVGWLALPGDSLAQDSNGLGGILQEMSRGGGLSGGLGGSLGGLGGGMSSGLPDSSSSNQNQTLQPQTPAVPMRQPPSRLEQIISARAGVRLAQFGYDQLGVGRQVMVPETGAVADDYIMGPGDEVVVSLRGQENNDMRSTVDRNGRVVLPRLAPIPASGRNFGSFRQDVDAAVRRAYVASTASVSLGRVRQISVLVSGEVNVPGPRIATGLSSVVDVIMLSNGIKKTGSLRNIRIERAGREYNVDLYGVLTGGGIGASMRLADGDRVIVPPLGPTVAVAGLVRRPGIYELPPHTSGMTVRALLALTGGQEVRGRYRLSVQRIEADGRLNLVPLENENGIVRDSEILRVELGADLTGTQATLSGGIGLAGQYPVAAGTRISDVLRAPGALGNSPYTLFGIIVRKDPRTLLRSLIAFTPVSVLNGTEDQPLQTDDIIRPISMDEAQMLDFVLKTYLDKLAQDQARIRNPLETQRADAAAAAGGAPSSSTNNSANPNAAATTSAAAVQAVVESAISPTNPFGLSPDARNSSSGEIDFSGVPADLQRADIIALLNVAAPGSRLAQQRQLAYEQSLLTATSTPGSGSTPAQIVQAQQAAVLAAEAGAPLQAPSSNGQMGGVSGGQMTLAPQQMNTNGANGANNQTSQTGQSGQSGQFGSENGENYSNPNAPPMAPNYQEQSVAPGEYASNREVRTFGELVRQLNIDPLVLANFLVDHRVRLDGAVRGPGPYFVGPDVSLADLVQAAGGTVNWADESGVELLTTVVDNRSGHAASQRETLPLRQGTLASYVVRPHDELHFNKIFTDSGIGSVTVQGEVRFAGNYPITRGEHLSDILMRAGGITGTAYPQGTVFLRKSAAEIERDGYNRAADEIQSQLLAGMARIGSDKIPGDAVTAIQGFITQLRTQKPLGRVAISADPSVLAANPSQDPLLEPGDVVFIPQRPSTVAVLGEVMQPGSFSYRPGMTVDEYVKKAGGFAQFANDDMTFIVMPDGTARRIEKSWLSFGASDALPPGSTIVVPRDLAPLFTRQVVLDITGIMSSLAVTLASLAVLAHN